MMSNNIYVIRGVSKSMVLENTKDIVARKLV